MTTTSASTGSASCPTRCRSSASRTAASSAERAITATPAWPRTTRAMRFRRPTSDPTRSGRADLLAAATLMVEVIRETRPQVMITYDENGNYGHPDHIQAHRVAMYGSTLAAAPTYRPDLGERMGDRQDLLARHAREPFPRGPPKDGRDRRHTRSRGSTRTARCPAFITPDDQLSARIDGHDYVDQKITAMQAHATQITVDGPFFALSNNLGNAVWAEEFYRIAKGRPAARARRSRDGSLRRCRLSRWTSAAMGGLPALSRSSRSLSSASLWGSARPGSRARSGASEA